MSDSRIHISAILPEVELPNPQPKKKTRRSKLRWKNLSYSRRVTLAFAGIAAMTALFAVLVLSAVWDRHFEQYTHTNMENAATSVALSIGREYEQKGVWDDETVQMAATYCSMYPTVGILVVGRDNVVRFDSTIGLEFSSDVALPDGAAVGDGAAANEGVSSKTVRTAPADSTEIAVAPINAWGTPIGWVRVWIYGSDTLMSSADMEFRDNSYQAMLIASILAILLACVVGYVFARNLVDPINRMTKTAEALKEGDLSARTGLTGEDEIAHLGETFDTMADAMQHERENERRLTTDVAHELRTPLMALRSTVEAMIDGVFEPDEERLAVVNNEVQRLSRMVDAILKLSHLENRTKPLKMDTVNVGDQIAEVVSTHEAFVADSGLEMTFDMEPDVLVKGDADLIRQATANLISNAVRYTPEGGKIHVSVSKGEIMSSIAVEDTGIGLSPDEAKKVFNRFWRSDAGRSRESGGLGIGLAVVKEIVDQHGGWVQVEGQKDVGARFVIHIPLYDEEAERARTLEAERKAKAKAKQEAKQEARQQQRIQKLEKQKAKADAKSNAKKNV